MSRMIWLPISPYCYGGEPAYLEFVSAVRSIADGSFSVCAVAVTDKDLPVDRLSAAGIQRILLLNPPVGEITDGNFASALAAEAKIHRPQVILMLSDDSGRSIMPRTAALLGAGLTADCTSLTFKNGQLLQTRPAFGGELLADILTNSPMQLATVRPFSLPPSGKEYSDHVVFLPPGQIPEDPSVRLLRSLSLTGSNTPDTEIVVSGGVVTATGGASAAGIGSGYVGSVSGNKMIPAGAVKITGGSIHAVCGSAPQTNIGDLIMSANANQIAGGDTALTITGGSVVGENGVVRLPSYYGVNDIVADENGVICLWLPANDKDDETDCYTFTAGGSTWKVRIEKTGFFRGIAVVPEKLRIGAFNVSRSGLRFTVSADDAQWLHLNAASLRIRVASSPAMTEENSKLLVPEVVENGDGTVTLEVAPDATPSGGSGFFKIEQ